jgi:hypothetical protein
MVVVAAKTAAPKPQANGYGSAGEAGGGAIDTKA